MSKNIIDEDILTEVEQIVIDHLNLMFKDNPLKPKGGFKIGYGYGFKIYGLIDVIQVNARFLSNQDNSYTGRLMINTSEIDTIRSKSRFDEIIKLLDGNYLKDILFNYELNAAGGHSYWFKFKI
ncbi:MAG: hypothetical protein EOO20_01675 [Chryseobacterium sp.]|nr:MAG: hypothetical protein EOO20_01675 [Chryseobacterium sp.]